jgi:hypothetical protein
MPAHMTATAYTRGLKNALICGISLAIIMGPSTAAFHSFMDIPWKDAWSLSLGMLSVPVLVIGVVYYFRGKNKAGRRLLDGGRMPGWPIFSLYAMMFFLFSVFGFFTASGDHGPLVVLAGRIVAMNGAILGLAGFLGRLEFRMNGIWVYWSLLPYDRIGSWRFKNNTLLIESRKPFLGYRGKGAIPIAPEQREKIEAILDQQCPDAHDEETEPEDEPDEGSVPVGNLN